MGAAKVTVFYDGLCILCSREIDHYRKSRGADLITFVDICAPGFDPAENGLDPKAVHKVMHVRRQDGTLAIEVDAFIEIWKTLPGYWLLAKLANYRIVKIFLNFGYQAFVKIRPYLPRRKSDYDQCSTSPHCEVPQKNDASDKTP